ncbi:MAG TPA: CoA transferase [Burkholderiales bacterium]|jgi:crotonobetainyl-CoA:carnitine CoA-transferase CaiB-like acyl-CoA transferase
MSGPLAGVKVLELAQIMAGPTCGLMLADLGADVIKVERVPGGDDTRRMDRPSVKGESASFMAMNRNKRGIALNLKLPTAQEALKRMAARSDVVTENYRKGTMEKLGLGYEALRAVNPAIIYCSISGYGRTGPYAEKGGYDLIAQGMSGLMGVTGEAGRAPVKSGGPVCDINAGLLGALGVVSAYVHRLKTGEGQLIDTSLFEAGIQQLYWQAAIHFATGEVPGPTGSAHILSAPYQAFRAADGWLNIGGANQANWERMCRVLGARDWLEDPRFRSNADRMKNLDALVPLMNARLKDRKVDDLIEALEAEGVPCGRINSIADVAADPQALAREMVVELEHPRAGRTRALGLPIKLSRTPGKVSRPAPVLGQHTREVLEEFGFSRAEIDSLVGSGAAVAA